MVKLAMTDPRVVVAHDYMKGLGHLVPKPVIAMAVSRAFVAELRQAARSDAELATIIAGDLARQGLDVRKVYDSGDYALHGIGAPRVNLIELAGAIQGRPAGEGAI